MTLRFKVEKVADLNVPLFAPDPLDDKNTIDSGFWVQEITLSRIPDPMRGGVGTLVFQVNESNDVGRFQPGQVVMVELRAA